MTVFLNGTFVPDDQAVLSVHDRGFLYGDGLFESVRVYGGRPFRLERHWHRLAEGARFLRIPLPFSTAELTCALEELLAKNSAREAIVRISLSRGTGRRGYSIRGADQPVLVMTAHPAPEPRRGELPRWKLKTASNRLRTGDPLAAFKTSNKLPQILARAEAEAEGMDEALLLNDDGAVAETSSGNLFWIEDRTVCTVPCAAGVLPGVTREFVLELCGELAIRTVEKTILPRALLDASGVFVTLSSLGIIEAIELDGNALPQSPLVPRLAESFEERARAPR